MTTDWLSKSFTLLEFAGDWLPYENLIKYQLLTRYMWRWHYPWIYRSQRGVTMNTLFRLSMLAFAIGLYVGCSSVKFDLDEAKCEQVGQNCIVQNGTYHFDNTVSVGGGKVDILIVDDNSASMSFEQKNLANRFSGFVSQLESASADYRIGIITTDISSSASGVSGNSPRAINGNGAFQDGKLIAFGSGVPYLTSSSAGSQTARVSLFNSTIVRPETAQCEQFIANWIGAGKSTSSSAYTQGYSDNCPSGDERGIFAANLAVKNNPNSFIRKDANLAIIFLSDEDVRSGLYLTDGNYPLSADDQPNSLITNIRAQFGDSKNIRVHSIVVKDNSCLAAQSNQKLGTPEVAATAGFVSGSKGNAYLTFPQTGWGQSVDICSLNYPSSLGAISTSIIDQINSAQLACENPIDLQVTLTPSNSSITWTVEGKNVHFNQLLPYGTTAKLVYDCTSI